MEDVRCRCGKIVCQIKGHLVIIKCRHCKRYVVIDTTKGLVTGDLAEDGEAIRVEYK